MDEPSDDAVQHCCFDDWASTNAERVRLGKSQPLVEAMLEQLDAAGLADRSVLDIGCGAGALALGALERGASRVHGVDLGAGAIDAAKTLAAERGFDARATFDVADGSRVALPSADVVALSRVVCCYEDAGSLLDNAIRASRDLLAVSAPVDRGLAGLANRLAGTVSNAWYAMRPRTYRGFRVFLHELGAIDEHMYAAGFTKRHHSRPRFTWDLAVYERRDAPSTASGASASRQS